MPMINLTMHTIVFCLTEGLSEEANITKLKGHSYGYVTSLVLSQRLWVSWDIFKRSLKK